MTSQSSFKFRYLGQYLLAAVSPWRQIDWILLLLVIGLTAFGGLSIYSTEIIEGYNYSYQHWTTGAIGVLLAIAIARWHYRSLLQWYWVIYALTNLSLIAVMVMGVTAKGAKSWLTVAGVNLQPSEFAKIAMVITISALLHDRSTAKFSTLFRTLVISCIPWGLIFLQPDLGTSLVFGAIALTMLYWANTNPGWLILMVSPLVSAILYHIYLPAWLLWVLIMAGVAWLTVPVKIVSTLSALAINLAGVELGNVLWGLLKDYQKARLILFLDPEKDPLGGGYHLIQSRIAIGAGQLWGKGLYHGSQTQLNFIPEQHTDFIFAGVGEEWGFVGSIIVVIVFWGICMRLLWIANHAKDNFGSLLAIGVLGMVAFQTIVNISMTIGLAPITGIPLPWMSYGRSSLISKFLAIGLVESVANHREMGKKH
jgi:rod shape determining protein RodA